MARSDLSSRQRAQLDRAIREAETASRVEFSVFRGTLTADPTGHAAKLHGMMAAPDRSVLVAVDPKARVIEIVTGAAVRGRLTDAKVRKVVKAMGKSLAAGDQVGALTDALAQLAKDARTR
ncbi:DUF5130 family protein [Nocardioides yefusunii]|uniref:DUF5130 family protein n=1 Tax=Nocardioides yefusunii TaxID=2500546 RepID=A0ABW1QVK0_9ACTN|nr:DUF5130 family protein [Nocardioides yefusunii]